MISPAAVHQGKILIVDDQLANALLLEQTLRTAGYASVSSTSDPDQVCELHRQHGYGLILLDLEMPSRDGFQVMDDLKKIETESYLPVLAITAYPEHKVRALQGGAKDFISKPFELAELLTRVYNMLEVRLLHEAACLHGKELEALALIDPLTGLANRRLLEERLSMALAHARRNKKAMALLYLDLDGFKQVNDSFGHGAGDLLLVGVTARLLALVREEDTVARVGGDEFVIALSDLQGAEQAAAAALKIIASISRPYEIEGHSVSVTASIGGALYPGHGGNAETLLKNADKAMFAAKGAGKNAYRVADGTGVAGGDGGHG